MELPCRKSRGRPKRRFMYGVKQDVKLVGVREDVAETKSIHKKSKYVESKIHKLHPDRYVIKQTDLLYVHFKCGGDERWK